MSLRSLIMAELRIASIRRREAQSMRPNIHESICASPERRIFKIVNVVRMPAVSGWARRTALLVASQEHIEGSCPMLPTTAHILGNIHLRKRLIPTK